MPSSLIRKKSHVPVPYPFSSQCPRMDSAGQKGTGKWTAINALDLGQPVTLIGEAVFSRCLSSLKEERTRASKVLGGPEVKVRHELAKFSRT